MLYRGWFKAARLQENRSHTIPKKEEPSRGTRPEFPTIQQDMPATKATWFYFSSTEALIPHLSLGLQPFVDFAS
jgi:hypothetical protein